MRLRPKKITRPCLELGHDCLSSLDIIEAHLRNAGLIQINASRIRMHGLFVKCIRTKARASSSEKCSWSISNRLASMTRTGMLGGGVLLCATVYNAMHAISNPRTHACSSCVMLGLRAGQCTSSLAAMVRDEPVGMYGVVSHSELSGLWCACSQRVTAEGASLWRVSTNRIVLGFNICKPEIRNCLRSRSPYNAQLHSIY